jgi:hypothetical protein
MDLFGDCRATCKALIECSGVAGLFYRPESAVSNNNVWLVCHWLASADYGKTVLDDRGRNLVQQSCLDWWVCSRSEYGTIEGYIRTQEIGWTEGALNPSPITCMLEHIHSHKHTKQRCLCDWFAKNENGRSMGVNILVSNRMLPNLNTTYSTPEWVLVPRSATPPAYEYY